MQINAANLEALYFAFDARYQAAYERTSVWYTEVATEAPSTTRENRYPFLALIPRFREWAGERVVHNVASRSFSVLNRDFELTIELDKNDIQDETFTLFNMSVDMMGAQARKWPDDVMTSVIQSGISSLCFDGQQFFDVDHPINIDNPAMGTYSNNFAGTALSAANYDAVRSAMMGYKGEDGKPLAVRPSLLVVPPQLEKTAREILNADMITTVYGSNTAAAAQTNVLKGSANLLVVPELANEASTWYLLDTSKPIKPFLFQLRQAPKFDALVAPTDPSVFWRKKFVYGSDARGAGSFTLPFLAARASA